MEFYPGSWKNWCKRFKIKTVYTVVMIPPELNLACFITWSVWEDLYIHFAWTFGFFVSGLGHQVQIIASLLGIVHMRPEPLFLFLFEPLLVSVPASLTLANLGVRQKHLNAFALVTRLKVVLVV